MANSENGTKLANRLISLVSKSIVPILILFVTLATIAYTWSIQQSCNPLIAVKLPDRCYIANVSIDFQRLPWQNTEPLVLKVREEKQLNAKVDLIKGSPAIAAAVSWQSTRPGVVAIDPAGKLVALQPGDVEIRAKVKSNPQKVAILKVQVLSNVSEASASEGRIRPTKTAPSASTRSQEPPVKASLVDRFKTKLERILPGTKQPETGSNSSEQSGA